MQITEQQYDKVINGLRVQLEIIRTRALEIQIEASSKGDRVAFLEKKLNAYNTALFACKEAMIQLWEVKYAPSKNKKGQCRKQINATAIYERAMKAWNETGLTDGCSVTVADSTNASSWGTEG